MRFLASITGRKYEKFRLCIPVSWKYVSKCLWKGTFAHPLFTTSRIIFGLAHPVCRSFLHPYYVNVIWLLKMKGIKHHPFSKSVGTNANQSPLMQLWSFLTEKVRSKNTRFSILDSFMKTYFEKLILCSPGDMKGYVKTI